MPSRFRYTRECITFCEALCIRKEDSRRLGNPGYMNTFEMEGAIILAYCFNTSTHGDTMSVYTYGEHRQSTGASAPATGKFGTLSRSRAPIKRVFERMQKSATVGRMRLVGVTKRPMDTQMKIISTQKSGSWPFSFFRTTHIPRQGNCLMRQKYGVCRTTSLLITLTTTAAIGLISFLPCQLPQGHSNGPLR